MKKLITVCMLLTGMLFYPAFAQESEQGDLIYVSSEEIAPENMIAYEQWNKEFMELAKGADMPNWWAFESEGRYGYAMNIGKTMAGKEEVDKKMEAAMKANPKFGELYSKYGYTIQTRRYEIWRHHPELSYTPANPSSEQNNYVRSYTFWIKGGKMKEAHDLLKEYKKAFEEAGIAEGYGVYSNVMGADANQMGIRFGYRDSEHWGAAEKVNEEKLSKKMGELWTKWSQVISKMEDGDSRYRPDISNPPNQAN